MSTNARHDLEDAAAEYARACARQPSIDVCSGVLGRMREDQVVQIAQEQQRLLKRLGEVAVTWAAAKAQR